MATIWKTSSLIRKNVMRRALSLQRAMPETASGQPKLLTPPKGRPPTATHRTLTTCRKAKPTGVPSTSESGRAKEPDRVEGMA